ncbi:MAG: hypothetical protein QM817_30735 [Archangium sp.]
MRSTLLVFAVLLSSACARKPGPVEGLWVAAEDEGFLEVVKLDEGRWSFALAEEPTTSYWLCAAEGATGDLQCAERLGCSRRVRIVPSGDAMQVVFGEGWSGTCAVKSTQHEWRLHRTDALKIVVHPWVEAMRESDLGASGGRMLYAALGPDPIQTATLLRDRLAKELRAADVDVSTLSLDDASTLLTGMQFSLALSCVQLSPLGDRCALPGEKEEDPLPVIDAAARESWRRFSTR